MRKSLRWLSLFMAPALVISLSALMVACGGDDEVADDPDDPDDPPRGIAGTH